MKDSLFAGRGDDQELCKLLRSFGVKPGLERIEKLLKLLGDPQHKVPVIHIAGTNGKGSTSSMIAHIAAASDLKTGWFTSPYLENFTERIRILDGKKDLLALAKGDRSIEISESDFADLLSQVLDKVREIQLTGEELPTEFEVLTAIAFLYFAEQGCDILVLETGMGGRLDSTNVCQPKVSLITALGYDHMEKLGSTIAEIAAEKAGIIKRGVPVIAYPPELSSHSDKDCEIIRNTLMSKAEAEHTQIKWIDAANIEIVSQSLRGQSFIYAKEFYELRLVGDFQLVHAALAIEACRDLVSEEAISEGLKSACWPGRMEVIGQRDIILLDGAHNPQGCRVLRQVLEKHLSGRKLNLLVGMLKDKQTEEMLQIILDNTDYRVTEVITTEPVISRAMSSDRLAEQVQAYAPDIICRSVSDYREALSAALELSATNGLPLVIAGSLYLIGVVRSELRDRKVLA